MLMQNNWRMYVLRTYSDSMSCYEQLFPIEDSNSPPYFATTSADNLESSHDYQWPSTDKWTAEWNE
jgi:hypothetical protein